MQHKDSDSFLRDFEKTSWELPRVLLLSGQDMELGELLIREIKKRLELGPGDYDLLVFSNEPQEAERLHTELADVPLFPKYRFIIVRQSEEVLKGIFSSRHSKLFPRTIEKMPGRTLVLFLYEGSPPNQVLKTLRTQAVFLHLLSTKLYGKQLEGALQRALQRRKWKLNSDAFYFLLENIESKTGSLEEILDSLDFLAKESKDINVEDLRSVLFPKQGWDPFALVDALFHGDQKQTLSQYKRFRPGTDNFFVLLKILLRRMDEIRLARAAYGQNMSEKELLAFLGLGSRPPFIQKKILTRLRNEIPRFIEAEQLKFYDFLIDMQKTFALKFPLQDRCYFFKSSA